MPNEEIPKKRGRPPKRKGRFQRGHGALSSQSSLPRNLTQESTSSTFASPEGPKPKREVDEEITPQVNLTQPKTKPRGRPRKFPPLGLEKITPGVTAEGFDLADGDGDLSSKDDVAEKDLVCVSADSSGSSRRRGRPRKRVSTLPRVNGRFSSSSDSNRGSPRLQQLPPTTNSSAGEMMPPPQPKCNLQVPTSAQFSMTLRRKTKTAPPPITKTLASSSQLSGVQSSPVARRDQPSGLENIRESTISTRDAAEAALRRRIAAFKVSDRDAAEASTSRHNGEFQMSSRDAAQASTMRRIADFHVSARDAAEASTSHDTAQPFHHVRPRQASQISTAERRAGLTKEQIMGRGRPSRRNKRGRPSKGPVYYESSSSESDAPVPATNTQVLDEAYEHVPALMHSDEDDAPDDDAAPTRVDYFDSDDFSDATVEAPHDSDFEDELPLAQRRRGPVGRPRNGPVVDNNAAFQLQHYRLPLHPPRSLRGAAQRTLFYSAVRRLVYLAAKGPLDPGTPAFSVGLMNKRCCECNALFFSKELKGPGGVPVSRCCQKGKVKIRHQPYPNELIELLRPQGLNHARFMNAIRNYNSELALAAKEAKNLNFQGPFVMRVQGQVVVTTPPVLDAHAAVPPGAAPSRHLQLLFVDPAEAKETRQRRAATRKLSPDILGPLVELLVRINALYRSCERMSEVKRAADEEWLRTGKPVPQITLVFKSKPNTPAADIEWAADDDQAADHRTFTPPVEENEISAIFTETGRPQHVPLYIRQHGRTVKLDSASPLRMPMLFPLLYPHGVPVWWHGMPHEGRNRTAVRNTTTFRQFACFSIQRRQGAHHTYFWELGQLTQEILIFMAITVEDMNLDYLARNCDAMRASNIPHLQAFLERIAQQQGYDVGRQIRVPSSFSHSPRQMQKRYQDCMQAVRVFGKPTFFLTFTANPNWPDILKSPFYRKGDASLNLDLTCRVFNMYLQEVIRTVTKDKVLGNCSQYYIVVEHQKRGLPHAHCLFWSDAKVETSDQIDSFISTEVPDREVDEDMFTLVTTLMTHRTCSSRCQDDKGKCKKGFPMRHLEDTIPGDDHHPTQFRRPVGGKSFTLPRDRATYNNTRIVPYNPFFLKKFRCHTNLLPVTSTRVMMYLFKYLLKGFDRAAVELTLQTSGHVIQDPARPNRFDLMHAALRLDGRGGGGGVRAAPVDAQGAPPAGGGNEPAAGPRPVLNLDEHTLHRESRLMTAGEATYRLHAFSHFETSFSTTLLPVHLEGENPVVFVHGREAEAAANPPPESMLTAFFSLVERSVGEERARLLQMRYSNVVDHYTWQPERFWRPRQRMPKSVLSRITAVSPKRAELFYLRLLLTHVRGPSGFQDIRTVDGTVHESFREAAIALGFATNDREFVEALDEAALANSAFAQRLLLVNILTHCPVADPSQLFELNLERMLGPWRRMQPDDARMRLLRFLMRRLVRNNVEPDPQLFANVNIDEVDELLVEEGGALPMPTEEERNDAYARLNQNQRAVVDKVLELVNEEDHGIPCGPTGRCVFLEGPAGTGKTHTYQVIVDQLRAVEKETLAMAFTGCAACLLPGGLTCHSALCLPVPLNIESVSNIQPHYKQWSRLQQASLIIVDEVAMAPSIIFDIMDPLLRRIKQVDRPFGGVACIFGGDFRQLGPIGDSGQAMETIHFRYSDAFSLCHHMSLEQNMRTEAGQADFARLLREIGEGKVARPELNLPDGCLDVPTEWVVPDQRLASLIHRVYLGDPAANGATRVILTHTNDSCTAINEAVLREMPGELQLLHSVDSIVDEDPANPLLAGEDDEDALNRDTCKRLLTQDDLHGIMPSGMPPHELRLKVGTMVVLLRNLDVQTGLVNGTRMKVIHISRILLRVKVVSDIPMLRGQEICLPRIAFDKEVDNAFCMRRVQFPVRVAFGMTVNKAQGCTLDYVGIYLPVALSDHGKLYVALSRVRRADQLALCIEQGDRQGYDQSAKVWFTANAVKRHIWDLTARRPTQPNPAQGDARQQDLVAQNALQGARPDDNFDDVDEEFLFDA